VSGATKASDLPRIHDLLQDLDRLRDMRRFASAKGATVQLVVRHPGPEDLSNVTMLLDQKQALGIIDGQFEEACRGLDALNVVDDRATAADEGPPVGCGNQDVVGRGGFG
jgi:hypothetical protein